MGTACLDLFSHQVSPADDQAALGAGFLALVPLCQLVRLSPGPHLASEGIEDCRASPESCQPQEAEPGFLIPMLSWAGLAPFSDLASSISKMGIWLCRIISLFNFWLIHSLS